MFPSGLQMLFKSLGFDPADFAAKIDSAQKAAIATVQHFDEQLRAIDKRLAEIDYRFDRIETLLLQSQEVVQKDESV